MRPRLPEGRETAVALLARLRAFFWRRRIGQVVGAAIAIALLDTLYGAFGRQMPAFVSVPAWIVLWLFSAWLGWKLLRWLGRRLLWRIRTKLILSYLFIALVPVVLLAVFFATAGVLVLVLSGSQLVVVEVDRIGELSQATAAAALADLPTGDEPAARAVRSRLLALRSLHPAASWTLLDGGRVVASEGSAPRTLPGWWKGGSWKGLVSPRGPHGKGEGPGRVQLRVAVSHDGRALIVDVPADGRFFADLERRAGIHVLQPPELEAPHGETGSARAEATAGHGPGQRIDISGGSGLPFVALPPRWDWDTGRAGAEDFVPLVFRFQPLDFVRRLSPQLSRESGVGVSLADILLRALGIVGVVFLVMYAVALGIGLLLARSITRGVHELSVGTQRLRHGDFDHAIPIRSRDQLGELAESFNHMSRGLQQLMVEQAEKERLEEELRIARQIQMSLLPGKGIALAGLRVAALCLPAAEVGGDYYDLLPLGDTRLGVLVADVSGKGTSAALYMAELKGLVLSLSRIYDSPARLLSEANRILAANMDSRSFVTMTYAVVDTGARCMRYARAGHNPVLHLDARSGLTRVLAPPGLGLGLDAGARFDRILEEAVVPLVPGDFFLFFTDGLSEAMNPGAELFGESRLRRILEQAGELGTDELKDRILAEVQQFVAGAAPHDDMTMVVLKVVEERAA